MRGPLRIVGRDPRYAVILPVPLLLAPMEGITEPVFRDLVIARGGVGAACTEFIRITNAALPRKVIAHHYGKPTAACPVGIQFMAGGTEHVTQTISATDAIGPAFIDLNFGCPAPVVFDKCAGSALLAHPDRIGRIVAASVAATGRPVTAKIRAGIDGPERLADLVCAVAEAGAAMITVHGRLRVHGYHQPASWQWIAEAVRVRDRVRPGMPVIGNGSVDAPEDASRLLAETGCDGVMIGRGALADPWIFARCQGAPPATVDQAVGFTRSYAEALLATYGERTALARTKQQVKYLRAGGCFSGREEQRQRLLRVQTLDELLDGLGAIAGLAGAAVTAS
jgi:tRNA-dihydrouridine synthase C